MSTDQCLEAISSRYFDLNRHGRGLGVDRCWRCLYGRRMAADDDGLKLFAETVLAYESGQPVAFSYQERVVIPTDWGDIP